ncbi:hypothetical protein FQZ97_1155250 [compost metagenome]
MPLLKLSLVMRKWVALPGLRDSTDSACARVTRAAAALPSTVAWTASVPVLKIDTWLRNRPPP